MSVFANILPPVLGSVYAPVKPDVPSNLLLQKYKDAAFAVSLRKLNANYLGNGLRIRRSTDNIEVNVAFDGQNKISTSSSIYNVDDEPTYEVSDDVNWTYVSGGAGYTNLSRSSLTLSSTYSTPYRIKLVFDATLSAGTKVTFGTYVTSISGSNWKVYPAQSDNSLAVSSATTLVSGSQGGTFTLTADATHFILENTSGSEGISCSGMTLTGSRGDTAATTLGQFISEAGSPPDMHVVTWYDQSGEANNATQTTADEQPKIVEFGTFTNFIKFDPSLTNNIDLLNNIPTTNQLALFITMKQNTASGIPFDARDGFEDGWRIRSTSNFRFTWQDVDVDVAFDSARQVYYAGHTGSAIQLQKGTESLSQTPNTEILNIINAPKIGGRNYGATTTLFDGELTEIIIYNTEQSANVSGIIADIQTNWDI